MDFWARGCKKYGRKDTLSYFISLQLLSVNLKASQTHDFFFLCVRLAEERQTTAEQALKHSAAEDRRQEMLDSLRGAGVENFTMRSAVPGSEVPGHKVSGTGP